MWPAASNPSRRSQCQAGSPRGRQRGVSRLRFNRPTRTTKGAVLNNRQTKRKTDESRTRTTRNCHAKMWYHHPCHQTPPQANISYVPSFVQASQEPLSLWCFFLCSHPVRRWLKKPACHDSFSLPALPPSTFIPFGVVFLVANTRIT
jgi:hypothetical protein